jgi:hypothetical protein
MAAHGSLLAAQAKWQQLAVSDDSQAQLLSMGFTASEVNVDLYLPPVRMRAQPLPPFVPQTCLGNCACSTADLLHPRMYAYWHGRNGTCRAVSHGVTLCRQAGRCASAAGMCRVRRPSCCSSASRQPSAARPTRDDVQPAEVQDSRTAWPSAFKANAVCMCQMLVSHRCPVLTKQQVAVE